MATIGDKTVRTPVGSAPIIPVLVIAAGAYLSWFGVHYWRSDPKWPTDPIKAVLTGKPVPTPDATWVSRALSSIGQEAAQQAAGATPVGGGSTGAGVSTPQTGTLSYAQIKQLWVANGGSPNTASIAAAIAEAESSGRTAVTSPNPDGGTNVGLWQLDTKGVGAGYTVDQLKDPATNARITVMHTSNGSNWNPWETWHTGAYREYLQGG